MLISYGSSDGCASDLIGSGRRAQLEMIGSPIGIDDEIGFEVRARRLDEDMDTLGGADAARRITDDPADRIASRHRTGADQLLAFLQHAVGPLTRGAKIGRASVGARVCA